MFKKELLINSFQFQWLNMIGRNSNNREHFNLFLHWFMPAQLHSKAHESFDLKKLHVINFSSIELLFIFFCLPSMSMSVDVDEQFYWFFAPVGWVIAKAKTPKFMLALPFTLNLTRQSKTTVKIGQSGTCKKLEIQRSSIDFLEVISKDSKRLGREGIFL